MNKVSKSTDVHRGGKIAATIKKENLLRRSRAMMSYKN
jgi:hypothetical protein